MQREITPHHILIFIHTVLFRIKENNIPNVHPVKLIEILTSIKSLNQVILLISITLRNISQLILSEYKQRSLVRNIFVRSQLGYAFVIKNKAALEQFINCTY